MKEFDSILAELRRSEPYIEDHGFSRAVMAQLPARPTMPLWKENLITLLATVLGSALAAWQFPAESLLPLLSPQSLSVGTVAVAAAIIYAFTCAAVWIKARDLV